MSTSSKKKHGVFLSFRGVDTRTKFTSHLYEALCNKGPFKTFIDYDIPRGEDAWDTISKAIEDSRVSIVVLSESYASSRWCLDELVKILECRKQQQVVIPVFYKVTPSRLANLTGSYQKAFEEHKNKVDRGIYNDELVEKWEKALKEVAVISGHEAGSAHTRDDAHLVKDVYNNALQMLGWKYPDVLEDLVETERNCKAVEQILLEEKNRKIGIWGMPGIGKTSIAKLLFAKLFPEYDYVCFVEEAKQYSQDKLMREILREEISLSNFAGPILGLGRLSGKKVFIVLDDMDNDSILKYVLKQYDTYPASDSKLIITAENMQLLKERVNRLYEVKTWEKPESLELFCLHAFMERCPPKDYKDLSDRAVRCAWCLPLALKVLGSDLHSKPTKYWESTLEKLEKFPHETVKRRLKRFYDGLDDFQKDIFLDIAFFYKGIKKDHVIRILDACGLYASSGVEDLKDKALVTISSTSEKIQMHGLLQLTGIDIVRQECKGKPEERSRLRDGEAHKVIEENKGTYTIQGISLDLSPIQVLHLCADTFRRMRRLRFLRFYASRGQSSSNTSYPDLPKDLEPFSYELRYFEWVGYPFTSLPFPPIKHGDKLFLVEIHLPHSKVEKLWEGVQELDHLEGIDLRECKQFKELPDLSKAPKLEWVNLSGSESLEKLHPSLLSSATLVTLMLDRCTKLKSVKCGEQVKSLKKISVNGCSSLKEFEVSSELVENLDLSDTAIQSLDTSIRHLVFLKWLKTLKLPDTIQVIDKYQLHVLSDGLPSLKTLHLKCSNLSDLPDNINVLSELLELKLDGSNVKTLPETIKDLGKLEILSVENCTELESLPVLPPCIRNLCAANCTSLVTVSNLKTLATEMMGIHKHISFKNCFNLYGDALKDIMESLHLTMFSAALHNWAVKIELFWDKYNSKHNFNSVELCLPGSRVPEKFKDGKHESFITIELPNPTSDLLVGFIYSVVLSPTEGIIMKKQATKIECKCHAAAASHCASLLKADTTELKSDHVFVWYDHFWIHHCLKEPEVRFEFCVVNDEGEVDGSIYIKECGVYPITASELLEVLPMLDMKEGPRKELEEDLERGRRYLRIERPDADENNGMSSQMHNQQDSSVLAELDLDSDMRQEPEERLQVEVESRKPMIGMTDNQDQNMNDIQETTSANEEATSKIVEVEVKQSLTRLSTEIDYLKAQLAQKGEKLARHNTETDDLKDRLAQIVEKLARHNTETDDLKDQLAQIKAKLGETERRKKELRVAHKECKKTKRYSELLAELQKDKQKLEATPIT